MTDPTPTYPSEAPTGDTAPDRELVPASKIAKWVYCPRLAYFEWVQGEWLESAETLDGTRIHRRVDARSTGLPERDEIPAEGEVVGRGVLLEAPEEQLSAKPDLIESAGDGCVRPVEYKRRARPDVPGHAYDPERVQVAAQALALRAHGYRVETGVIYYATSKTRVTVSIDDDLVAQARAANRDLREAARNRACPPPLVDSPKCVRCALAPLCLPDETAWLRGELRPDADEGPGAPPPIRPLAPSLPDGNPVHINIQGCQVGMKGDQLEVRIKGEAQATVGVGEISSFSVYGAVNLTTPALSRLMREGIPVAWHTRGGYLTGLTVSTRSPNLGARQAQYAAAEAPERCQAVAAQVIRNKIANQRTILRRNHRGDAQPALQRLSHLGRRCTADLSLDTLRGFEGDAAATYFAEFNHLLKPKAEDAALFHWTRRSRRPPADPTNAALSFCYALLTSEWTGALQKVGLDPMLGYLHVPRAGRPALALDLMEPYRPIVADSVVLTLINNGQLNRACFVTAGDACALTATGRHTVLDAWEARLGTIITHPTFGYPVTYRRVFEVQARLFTRYLTGELDHYPDFKVR